MRNRKKKTWFERLKMFVVGDYKRGGLLGIYHWIRCHVWNRYHIINISGEDGYDWGWIDRSSAMELACWKILKEFVELEDPKIGTRTFDDYKDPDDPSPRVWMKGEKEGLQIQLDHDKEIRNLYDWWVKGRREEHNACDELLKKSKTDYKFIPCKDFPGSFTMKQIFKDPKSGKRYYDQWLKEHKRLEDKDEEMLMRLMKVRPRLWT